MKYWLFKTDPDSYSFDQFAREGRTVWDGVRNAQAQSYLRGASKGDAVMIYHTGDEKAIIGLAEVTRNPYPDPDADDDRTMVLEICVKSKLPNPVTLTAIKADPALADFALVRNSRLSVMPVTDAQWAKLLSMALSA